MADAEYVSAQELRASLQIGTNMYPTERRRGCRYVYQFHFTNMIHEGHERNLEERPGVCTHKQGYRDCIALRRKELAQNGNTLE